MPADGLIVRRPGWRGGPGWWGWGKSGVGWHGVRIIMLLQLNKYSHIMGWLPGKFSSVLHLSQKSWGLQAYKICTLTSLCSGLMLWTRHQLKPSVPHPFPAAYDQAVPRFREGGGGLFLEGDLNRGWGGHNFWGRMCVYQKCDVTPWTRHPSKFFANLFFAEKNDRKRFFSWPKRFSNGDVRNVSLSA